MGWNLQTWLWGTVIIAVLTSFVSSMRLDSARDRTFANGEPTERQLEWYEFRKHSSDATKVTCACLVWFCVVTYFLFF